MVNFTVSNLVPCYVLIPKTGTTTLTSFMNSCTDGIISPFQKTAFEEVVHSHHKQCKNKFQLVTLRDPVERFKSFLNYRQSAKTARGDWIRMGIPFHTNLTIILDYMTNSNMLSFDPYVFLMAYHLLAALSHLDLSSCLVNPQQTIAVIHLMATHSTI